MITSSFFKYSFLHAKVRPLAAELDQHRIVRAPRTARYSRETLNGENELTSVGMWTRSFFCHANCSCSLIITT